MTQSQRLRSGNVQPPASTMSVYEAIHSRRMNNEFTDDVPPRESMERMIDAAIWAPNHRLTNPWRFFVLEKGGVKRAEVAQLAYDNIFERSGQPRPRQRQPSKGAGRARVDLRIQRAWRSGRPYAGKLRRRLLCGPESPVGCGGRGFGRGLEHREYDAASAPGRNPGR